MTDRLRPSLSTLGLLLEHLVHLVEGAGGVTVDLDDYQRKVTAFLVDQAEEEKPEPSAERKARFKNRFGHDYPPTPSVEDRVKYAQETAAELVALATSNMGKIKHSVEAAIGRIKNWGGSPVVIQASFNEDSWARKFTDHSATDEVKDATVIVGRAAPDATSFTFFGGATSTKDSVDDILDAGDTDFFHDDAPATQADYFNLVNALRNPGGTGSTSKPLVLYTARPVRDRARYEDAKDIPTNLFLTTKASSAAGLAVDLAGTDTRRDVWKLTIDPAYLVQTLDTPGEKQYQSFGGGKPTVPVKRISAYDLA